MTRTEEVEVGGLHRGGEMKGELSIEERNHAGGGGSYTTAGIPITDVLSRPRS